MLKFSLFYDVVWLIYDARNVNWSITGELRYDHPRHHRSDHVIGTASLAQCSSCIVETDKDSPLLITSVATSLPVISMFRINDRFERIRIFGLFVLAL